MHNDRQNVPQAFLCYAKIANKVVSLYTEYELPASVVNKSEKPLWYCGINKNSRGKMYEIISVYHVFYTLG